MMHPLNTISIAQITAALMQANTHPPQPAPMLKALTALLDMDQLVPSAVLVPLIRRQDRWQLLFTERSAGLNAHGGEISFPGGRIDPGDIDPVDCALRETEEEVGIARSSVQVLGQLSPYVVRSGYHVTPVVGVVPAETDLTLEAGEVAGAFEVALDRLAHPELAEFRNRDMGGGYTVPIPHLPLPEAMIWGATAGMTLNLLDVLKSAPELPDRQAAE